MKSLPHFILLQGAAERRHTACLADCNMTNRKNKNRKTGVKKGQRAKGIVNEIQGSMTSEDSENSEIFLVFPSPQMAQQDERPWTTLTARLTIVNSNCL